MFHELGSDDSNNDNDDKNKNIGPSISSIHAQKYEYSESSSALDSKKNILQNEIKEKKIKYDNYEVIGDVVQYKTPPSVPKRYLSESPGLGSGFITQKITLDMDKAIHLNCHMDALDKYSLIPVFNVLSATDPCVDLIYKEQDPDKRLALNEQIQSTNDDRFDLLHKTASQIQTEWLPVGEKSYFNVEYRKIMKGNPDEKINGMLIYFILFYLILFCFILFSKSTK